MNNIVVHHLIDICDVEDEYSVYNYQKDVRSLIVDTKVSKNQLNSNKL